MDAHSFLGLEPSHNPNRWTLPVTAKVSVRHGFLFGGCGLAAAIAAMEAVTERPVVWATAQYLSFARPPSIVDIDVVVPVSGRHTTQARAIGHVADREIFTVNAALGRRDFEHSGAWATMPAVPAPEDCPPMPTFPVGGVAVESIHSRINSRWALGRFGPAQNGAPSTDGRCAIWAPSPEDLDVSAALLAVLADWMPSGIGHALGVWGGGNSLDNTIRIVRLVPTEWILCEIHVDAVYGGFGHGSVRLWAQDGTLMATASQSVIARLHGEIK
jgi:acyl-CoA thioesterase-2